MFALILVALMSFASIAIDVGLLRNDRQQLANAVDSAALAGGTMMPVDGSIPGAAARVDALVANMMSANYPGLPRSYWSVGYKCLIGVDSGTPPQPYISRDVPATCDPSRSLGRQPVAADFEGAGSTRFSSCDPHAGDKCNVVFVQAQAKQDYTFGRVVGVPEGWTGVVDAAACNGPCGEPPATPVDLLIIIDRTASMSNADVQGTRDAANAVLQIYDPDTQHVGLGLLGPSSTTSTCGTPAVSVKASALGYGTNVNTDLAKWIPVGLTGTGVASPGYAEQYVDALGNLNSNSHIVAAIGCFDHPGGTGTNLTTPLYMAKKYLETYGRPGAKWGIILETDGQPSYGSTGDPANYTCASADAAATAAKGANIELFTVGFGLDGANNVNCPDTVGTWSGRKVTSLLASMATGPSDDDLCTAAENTDSDHFYCQPRTADLATVFEAAASSFAGIRTHLVRLYPVPDVDSLSPSGGNAAGGNLVTISGKYFTGATRVTFGSAPVPFTVVGDGQITATAPAGTQGSSVDVIVTTPGGSSPVVAGDRYTFN